ncbi:MAG: hypothetical protein JNJ75_06530 [Cyclobacteriaceae bacterium]|nr:hypothetical protein [Cyclobacteriaceae bacterium]
MKYLLLFLLATTEAFAQQPAPAKSNAMTLQQTTSTTWQINGKKVSQRTFKKLLNKLKEVDGTWTCMETRRGGITRYQAKDKNGVVYQYEGRQEKNENGQHEDEQSLTLISNIP